jgi:hypothetical protein
MVRARHACLSQQQRVPSPVLCQPHHSHPNPMPRLQRTFPLPQRTDALPAPLPARPAIRRRLTHDPPHRLHRSRMPFPRRLRRPCPRTPHPSQPMNVAPLALERTPLRAPRDDRHVIGDQPARRPIAFTRSPGSALSANGNDGPLPRATAPIPSPHPSPTLADVPAPPLCERRHVPPRRHLAQPAAERPHHPRHRAHTPSKRPRDGRHVRKPQARIGPRHPRRIAPECAPAGGASGAAPPRAAPACPGSAGGSRPIAGGSWSHRKGGPMGVPLAPIGLRGGAV